MLHVSFCRHLLLWYSQLMSVKKTLRNQSKKLTQCCSILTTFICSQASHVLPLLQSEGRGRNEANLKPSSVYLASLVSNLPLPFPASIACSMLRVCETVWEQGSLILHLGTSQFGNVLFLNCVTVHGSSRLFLNCNFLVSSNPRRERLTMFRD